MKIAAWIIIAIVVFLAISAGIAKAILSPRELTFFGGFGISNLGIIVFGVLQIIGAICLLAGKTRTIGVILVAITFVISAGMLAYTGDLTMAIVSVVVVVLLIVAYRMLLASGNRLAPLA